MNLTHFMINLVIYINNYNNFVLIILLIKRDYVKRVYLELFTKEIYHRH